MFKINKNDVSEIVLVFLFITLNIFHTFFLISSVSVVEFEQVNVSWEEKK